MSLNKKNFKNTLQLTVQNKNWCSLVRISMYAISSYRGNRPTNTQKHTDRTDNNTLRRSFASAQCNKKNMFFKTECSFKQSSECNSYQTADVYHGRDISVLFSRLMPAPRPARKQSYRLLQTHRRVGVIFRHTPPERKIMGHHHILSVPYFLIFPLLIPSG